MVNLKILENNEQLQYDYDAEADVLYISVGEPQAAEGVDVGEGVIFRYREDTGELVGITIVGLKQRSLAALNPS